MESKVRFEVSDISQVDNSSNDDFFIAKMRFLSCGENSHHLNISEEVLRRDAKTALGKWVVADYQEYLGDVGSHSDTEKIVGVIPRDSEITFEESDNGLFACAEVILSKIYASDVYDIFTKDNKRSVSVEMRTISNQNDEKLIEKLEIFGITILGKAIQPSCTLSDIVVTKFSEEKANEYYHNQKEVNSLKHFAEERRKLMAEKTYKVNKTELKDTAWGNIDKTSLRNVVMSAKNKDKIAHDVYALVEDNWESSPSEHLKYPLMELVGDTFYYNRGALSSALGYAKKENESEVVAKVEKLYKKFKLEEGDKAKMENKEFAIQGREAWGDVISQVEKHEGGHVYVDSVEKDKIIYTTKDGVRYDVKADVEVGKDDKTVDAKIDWATKKKSEDQADIHKFEDESNEEDEDDVHDDIKRDKDEKKMSYNAYVDVGAMNEMLENETEEYKKLLKDNVNLDDMNVIMADYLVKAKRVDELECKLAEIDKEKEDKEKMSIVDKTFEDLKCAIPEKDVADFKEKANGVKFSEIDSWVNEVKLFAYENGTPKKEESEVNVFSFAGNDDVFSKYENSSNKDVFSKYLNK